MATFRRPIRRYPSRVIALATVVAALAAAPRVALATDYYYTGNSYMGNIWSFYQNWLNNSSPPSAFDATVFFGPPATDYYRRYYTYDRIYCNQDMASADVRSLSFDYAPTTLTGNQINVAGGVGAQAANNEIYNTLNLTGSVNGTVVFGMYGAGNLNLKGEVKGAAKMRNISGLVLLTGNIHPDGGVEIASGAMRLQSYDALSGTTDVRLMGGNLILNGYNASVGNLEFGDYSNTNTGAITGTGNITLGGHLYYQGTSNRTTNAVTIANPLNLSSGSHLIAGNYHSSADNDILLTGGVSGSGGIEVNSPMNVQLKGTNTYQGATYIYSGARINLASANTLPTNTALTVNGALVAYSNSQTVGSLNGNGAIYMGYGSLTVGNSSNSAFGGVIDGSSGLVKQGSGTLTLSGVNTYTGDTAVNGGRLIDANPHGNYLLANGSELEFANTTDRLFYTVVPVGPPTYNTVSGTGNFTKSGAGGLYAFISFGYSGSTTVNGGSITALNNNVLPTSTALTVNTNGTFLLGGSLQQTVASLSGAGTLNLGSSSGFTVNGSASTTFSGKITGGASFTKAGTSTLTLTGLTNDYSGGTTVSAGRLVVAKPNGNYSDNATLEVSNDLDQTLSGTVSGSGNFVKSGTGTLTATGALSNSGTVTISGGRLAVPVLARNYTDNAQLEQYGATNTSQASGTKIDGTGALIKSGTGTLTLGANNTYSGGTSILGGKIVTTSTSSLGQPGPLNVASGATLTTDAYDLTVTGIQGDGTISISGAKLTVGNATDNTFGGLVTGNSSTQLVKNGAGTLTLKGANTYSGLTTVNAGRLIVAKPAADYSVASALEFAFETLDQTAAGKISGAGSLTKSGSGILRLTGNNNYTGSTSVLGGTLFVSTPTSGAYTNGGILQFVNSAAGTIPGAVSNTGTLTFANTGTTTVTGSISGGGVIRKTGTGRLELNSSNSFTAGLTLNDGTTAANATGAFANGNVTLLGGSIDTNANAVVNNLTFGDGTVTNTGNVAGVGLTLNGGIALRFAPNKTTAPVSITAPIVLGNSTNTLSDNGARSSGPYDVVLSGVISGASGFTKSSAGTAVFKGGNTYTGGTAVNAGTLFLGATNALPVNGALTVAAGATVSLNPTDSANGVLAGSYDQTVGALSGAGKIQLGTSALTVNSGTSWDGVISGAGSFRKTGSGSFTLTGANTYSGGTEVQAGYLHDVNPHGNYNVFAGTSIYFENVSPLVYNGAITGAGSFVNYGTLTLTGANTFTGRTYVYGGHLTDTNPHGNYYTVAELEFQAAGNQSLSGSIQASGFVTKSGAGTLTLTGANSYGGGTTVKAGTLAAGSTTALASGNVTLVGGDLRADVPSVAVQNLTFGNGTATSTGTFFGTGSIALTGGLSFNFKSGAATAPASVAGALVLGIGTHALSDNGQRSSGAYDAVLSGAITGAGSLNKTGSGLFAMTGASSYTGATTLGGGTLFAAAPNVLSSSSAFTVASGATLSLNPLTNQSGVNIGSYSQTIASLSGGGNVLLGSAILTVGDSTDTTFTGALSGTGSLNKVGTGTLTLSGLNNAYANTTIGGGKLIVDKPVGDYLDNAILQFSAGTASGTISGTGSIVKAGSGVLTLSGDNSYSGGTSVQGGRLIVAKPVGDYVNAGILEFSSGIASGKLSGAGSLVKSGSGTVTLSGLNNSYTGGTTIEAGRLIVAKPVGLYHTAGILEIQNATDLAFDGRTVDGTGGFTKSGAGTLELTQKLGSTGDLEIKEGTLKSTSTLLAGRKIVGDANATLQLETTGTTFYTTDYSGEGNLLKSGSGRLILDGPLANTGSTTVAQGALYAVSGLTLNGMAVNAGARFVNDAQDTVEFAQRVTNRGEIVTTDGSTTVFDALVNGAGKFTGGGVVNFNGGFSPGNSPASVTLQGDMVLGSSNDLTMELGGTTLGTGYDHLNVLGTATLGGSLTVAYYNGFSPTFGQSFDLFDFSSSSGAFSSINLPTLGGGLAWNTSALYTTGTLSVQAVPEPASLAALGLGALALLRRRKGSKG